MYGGKRALCLIEGKIVHGKGLGRFLGIPTANVEANDKSLSIEDGVYTTKVFILGDEYNGVVNIGRRPTVDNLKTITIEVNIIDFNKDIYGQEILLELIEKIRKISKFKDLDELVLNIRRDLLFAIDKKAILPDGVTMEAESNSIVFSNKRIMFSPSAFSLLFLLFLNPSCKYSLISLYIAVYHKKPDGEDMFLSLKELIRDTNSVLLENGIRYAIEQKDGFYCIRKI